ncbi:MAG: DnaJ domain-containing protein [Clostridia bacterium]|nr:DnaJ domain-containing protein [Clostridia bacterium]
MSRTKDPYKILGVSKNASDEEIKAAYRELVKKYHPDNYDSSNPLRDLANEKMQEVNEAYDEIQKMRAGGGKSSRDSSYDYYYTGSTSGVYADVRRMINDRKFTDAEKALTAVSEIDRTAEWHYLASVLLMHRNRQNDAMRELEIACNMDPSNVEYQKAKEMFNNSARGYGSTYYGGNARPVRSSTDDACNCCANLICLDCLCECLGGDFISCL